MLEFPEHSAPGEETAELAALFCLDAMDSGEKEQFENHLSSCEACRRQVDDYAAMLGRWALSATPAPRANARERFLSLLRSEMTSPTDGVLLNRNGLLIARSAAMEWQPAAAPGIWAKPLFFDAERKYATSLVRMDKGVHYPSHRHADVEEVYLLSGDLQVEGSILRAGDYCRAEPHSVHSESYTTNGCLFILMSSQMDQVIG